MFAPDDLDICANDDIVLEEEESRELRAQWENRPRLNLGASLLFDQLTNCSHSSQARQPHENQA